MTPRQVKVSFPTEAQLEVGGRYTIFANVTSSGVYFIIYGKDNTAINTFTPYANNNSKCLPFTILNLSEITAAQNEVALSYRRVRVLYFLAVIFAETIFISPSDSLLIITILFSVNWSIIKFFKIVGPWFIEHMKLFPFNAGKTAIIIKRIVFLQNIFLRSNY